MNVVYIGCAALGFILLVVGVVFDDVLDAIDGLELGSDWASVPVLGAGLGAFGVVGWLTVGPMGAASLVVAGAGALVFAIGAAWFVAKVRHGATDATPRSSDLVGVAGKVVTPVVGGRGEVLVRLGGQPRKLTALSEHPHPLGDQVVVVEAVSDSSVRVMSHDEFWGADTTLDRTAETRPTGSSSSVDSPTDGNGPTGRTHNQGEEGS